MQYNHPDMSTTFTSTHFGNTAKRSSNVRTYTHAVWYRRTANVIARDLNISIEARDAAAAGAQKRLDAQNFSGVWTAETLAEYRDGCKAQAIRMRAELERHLADPKPGPWKVAGWCGRRDLADKLASTTRRGGKHEVAIEVATVRARK